MRMNDPARSPIAPARGNRKFRHGRAGDGPHHRLRSAEGRYRRGGWIVWVGACLLILLGGLQVMVLARMDVGGPLKGWLITVDPGHGGHDRGACHFSDGLIEKEINLDMAFRLQDHLRRQGADVILTRTDDTFVPLDARAQLANQRSSHLFISIHVNRYPSAVCFGAQTFYFPSSPESRRLAWLIQDELLKVDPKNYRQALPGNYRVLRQARMPAALVEVGFITNPGDRAKLRDFQYRERVAESITRGVLRFARGETIPPES